ncbi:MAG TPA: type II toxin-antitoxin system RelE/ParE family toxin [Streptosporangiaceae bacterium]|nr:type II toxin-antitoxin system RelE/ParE family toxin [Streptosporangiaceae bacterium]
MGYTLVMTLEVRAWLHDLRRHDRASAILVGQAIGMLLEAGPELGRPLADRVHHSRLSNLKELRPGSAGRSEIRILYIFDPRRNAVLLVAGDKAGQWDAWYRRAIPLAEERYEDYLKQESIR